jgi:antitoxin (DNA-binding transcriptional repressor) of toxin-antitoxin stability system
MTIQIDITEAQQRFHELILAASRGETTIITKDMLPIAQILPTTEHKKLPHFGSAHGLITITDQFDLPLDEFQAYMP